MNRTMRWFDYKHSTDFKMQRVSVEFYELARTLDAQLAEGPEKSTCLRKLLEAKDCAVRAAVEGREDQ